MLIVLASNYLYSNTKFEKLNPVCVWGVHKWYPDTRLQYILRCERNILKMWSPYEGFTSDTLIQDCTKVCAVTAIFWNDGPCLSVYEEFTSDIPDTNLQ